MIDVKTDAQENEESVASCFMCSEKETLREDGIALLVSSRHSNFFSTPSRFQSRGNYTRTSCYPCKVAELHILSENWQPTFPQVFKTVTVPVVSVTSIHFFPHLNLHKDLGQLMHIIAQVISKP